jgi:uroporphyrinogen-III synthase
MKVLVTRPAEDAEALAATLRARGIEPLIEPLLTIELIEDGARRLAPLLEGAQAALFTSANGVRAFAAATTLRGLPAFAVGDATAAAARAAGFATVESAGGAVGDLARLVAAKLQPDAGALVHAAASSVAGDLAGALSRIGYEVRRAVLYEAVPASRLSETARQALTEGAIDLALFFSPRTAATFVRLAEADGLAATCSKVTALALSPAVAAALVACEWRSVAIAEAPTEASLLAAVERASAARTGAGSMSDAGSTDGRGEAGAPEIASVPPRPAPPPPPRGNGVVAFLSLLLLAVVALVLSAPYWEPMVAPLMPWGPHAGDTAGLQARLAADEQRMARLEDAARDAVHAPALGALAGRVGTLEQRPQSPSDLAGRVAALEQRPQGPTDLSVPLAPLRQDIERLTTRLDGMERRARARSESGARGLLTATNELRAAVAGPHPYAAQLAAATEAAHGRPELEAALKPLAAGAGTGIPSLAQLEERFNQEVAPAVLRAAAGEPASQSWSDLIVARLRALVVVHRIDGAAQDDPSGAAVSSAQHALAQDDLDGAITGLEKLSGAPGHAAQAWLAAARLRREAELTLAALTRQVEAALAADEAQ